MQKADLKKALSLQKSEIKKYVTSKMFSTFPDYANNITNKSINKCIIYLEGYVDCLVVDIMPPINSQELKDHLLKLSFDFILKELRN